ncbi:MAG: hypothetical protein ACOYB0_00030 [Polynucleobacter sp.]
MSTCIDQVLLQVTLRVPRDLHEIPRIAANQPVHFGHIGQVIRPIPVVLSHHQKLKLLYAENR